MSLYISATRYAQSHTGCPSPSVHLRKLSLDPIGKDRHDGNGYGHRLPSSRPLGRSLRFHRLLLPHAPQRHRAPASLVSSLFESLDACHLTGSILTTRIAHLGGEWMYRQMQEISRGVQGEEGWPVHAREERACVSLAGREGLLRLPPELR